MADPRTNTLDNQESLQKLIKTQQQTQHNQLLTTNWSLAGGWQRASLTQRQSQFCQKKLTVQYKGPKKQTEHSTSTKIIKRKYTECLKLFLNLPFHQCWPTTSRIICHLWSYLCCYKFSLNKLEVARNLCTMMRNYNKKKKKQEGRATVELAPTVLRLFDYFLFKIFKEAVKDFQEVLDWILIPSDDIFACNHTDICYVYYLTTLTYIKYDK